jgi:hypothetical protein
MRNYEQRSRIRHVKSDHIPGTAVLAVERKETAAPVATNPIQYDPEVVPDGKQGNAAADNPEADRFGRAPNAPTASPAENTSRPESFEVK